MAYLKLIKHHNDGKRIYHNHVSKKSGYINTQSHISNDFLDDLPFTFHITFNINVFQKLHTLLCNISTNRQANLFKFVYFTLLLVDKVTYSRLGIGCIVESARHPIGSNTQTLKSLPQYKASIQALVACSSFIEKQDFYVGGRLARPPYSYTQSANRCDPSRYF